MSEDKGTDHRSGHQLPSMETDSGSDSDASHVSTTPPRGRSPPSPPPQPSPSQPQPQQQQPPPPPPPPLSILLSSIKSRTKSRHSSIAKPRSSSKITKPGLNSNSNLNHNPVPDSTPSHAHPFSLPNLRYSGQNRPNAAANSFETLPAGYFSKVASFSKLQKSCPKPDPVEKESLLASASILKQPHATEAISTGTAAKFVKKHCNLIGPDVNPMPVKRPKCSSEGNFVRLNINGYGRKFANKGKKKNYYQSGAARRTFKKTGGKSKAEGEADENGDGLVLETPKMDKQGKVKYDNELIEKAVLELRDGVSDEKLMKLLRLTHGYDSFRDGQLEAIKLVLEGKSTMLVLPTGAGKSLCYQLPALVLPGITLVVSPLVALMIDQLKQLPAMILGGLLSSSQSAEETSETLQQLREGTIKVLFVSPERFLNAEFLSTLSASPPISLVVVDEAHCVSEWSHNFRPSYMRLTASLLRDKLNATCILAMTATATNRTLHAVMDVLEIPASNLIQTAQLRGNLQLSVSLSKNRMKDLMMLVKSPPISEIQSIIIYCKFQSDTDSISKYLCDNNISAKSYHSGMPAKDRSRTQDLFCSNKIRVVVATVAFGMGLNKSDVGAVIHFSLPESLEEYVQEIGRAGRDGNLSYCHLLLDDITYFKLRSLMHSDGVDEYSVNKFLCQVFSDFTGSPTEVHSIVKEAASRKFDMKEEVMLTILTRLELGEVQFLSLLPPLNATCNLNFHKTTPALLAGGNIVVAAILKKSETKQGKFVFDLPTVANSIGVTTIDILNQLLNLKLKGEITYEMKDPAFCYTIVDVPGDLCRLAAFLTKWLSEVESCKVQKLDAMFNAAVSAVELCEKKCGCHGVQHTTCLQRKISDYFSGDVNGNTSNKMDQSSRFLRADIKVFLQSNPQVKFTPRAVARIMHGVASPTYPSSTWSRTHFWGRYMQMDFQAVMQASKAELMNFVGKDVRDVN